MTIIDAQVHVYERDHPGRPWRGSIAGPLEVTGEQMVAAMDAAGVDAALLVSPWTMYGADTSLAEDVFTAHPQRFRLIAPIDPNEAGMADRVDQWAATPGAAGIRLMTWGQAQYAASDVGVARVVDAAIRADLPICVMCWDQLTMFRELAETFPAAQFVLDHVGLRQPMAPPVPIGLFDQLADVLALASLPNAALKITGACVMSREPFPFADLWGPIGRLIEAFGVDRTMWGTDWTRATALLGYRDAVDAFRDHWPLSGPELGALMGGTAHSIFRWSRPNGGPR
jgi:L-fuconolactonase